MTLARIPNPDGDCVSSPIDMIGTSPVISVNNAIFDDVFVDGFSEPAANNLDEISVENANEEMIPVTVNEEVI